MPASSAWDAASPPRGGRPRPHRPRQIPVRDLNPQLLCALCGGYLIDATTITECLHSFCRACVMRFFETSKFCPICDAPVHKTRPQVHLRRDKTLQELVYKLVPGLFHNEMRQRREFYSKHPEAAPAPGEDPAEARGEARCLPGGGQPAIPAPPRPAGDQGEDDEEEEEVSVRLTLVVDGPGGGGDSAEPPRYLLAPAAFTVACVKKFVRLKYDLGHQYRVRVLPCCPGLRRGVAGSSLGDHLTLADIADLVQWTRLSPLPLYFIVYTPRPRPTPEAPEPVPAAVREEPGGGEPGEAPAPAVVVKQEPDQDGDYGSVGTSSPEEEAPATPPSEYCRVEVKREALGGRHVIGTIVPGPAAAAGLECRIQPRPADGGRRQTALAFLEEYVSYVHTRTDEGEAGGEEVYDGDDEGAGVRQQGEGSPSKYLPEMPAAEVVEEEDTEVEGESASPSHESEGSSPTQASGGQQRPTTSGGNNKKKHRKHRKRSRSSRSKSPPNHHPKIIKSSPSADRFSGQWDEKEPIKITIKIPSPTSASSGGGNGGRLSRQSPKKGQRGVKRGESRGVVAAAETNPAGEPVLVTAGKEAAGSKAINMSVYDFNDEDQESLPLDMCTTKRQVSAPTQGVVSEIVREQTDGEEVNEEDSHGVGVVEGNVVESGEHDVNESQDDEIVGENVNDHIAEDVSANEEQPQEQQQEEEQQPFESQSGSTMEEDSPGPSIQDITHRIEEGSAMVIESVNSVMNNSGPLTNLEQMSNGLLPNNNNDKFESSETIAMDTQQPVVVSSSLGLSSSYPLVTMSSTNNALTFLPQNGPLQLSNTQTGDLQLTTSVANHPIVFASPPQSTNGFTTSNGWSLAPQNQPQQQQQQLTGGHLINGNGNIIVNNTQLPPPPAAANPGQAPGFLQPGTQFIANGQSFIVTSAPQPQQGLTSSCRPLLPAPSTSFTPNAGAPMFLPSAAAGAGGVQLVVGGGTGQQTFSPFILNTSPMAPSHVFYTQNNVQHNVQRTLFNMPQGEQNTAAPTGKKGGGGGRRRAQAKPAGGYTKPKPIAPSITY